MAHDPGPAGSDPYVWSALGTLAAAFGTGFLFLLGRISRSTGDLWMRLNKHTDDAGKASLAAEQRFATKADLTELTRRMDEGFRDTREHVAQLIANRPPVRQR